MPIFTTAGLTEDIDSLTEKFTGALRPIALRSVRCWFNRARLDQELAHVLAALPECDLVYAIDASGRQMSSNVCRNEIDMVEFQLSSIRWQVNRLMMRWSGMVMLSSYGEDRWILHSSNS